MYAYIIVSDPTLSFSFVLAENVDEYKADYEAGALEWMSANGFDKLWNMPRNIEQGGDCKYSIPTAFV